MSDQYYYLLDGKEHGPFSRAAIASLLKSGKLDGALLKTAPNQAWQTADEIGLAVASQSPSPVAQTSRDPAAVVFRSQREIKAAKSGGSIGVVIGEVFLVAVVAVGVWFGLSKTKPSEVSQLPDVDEVNRRSEREQLPDVTEANRPAQTQTPVRNGRLQPDDVCSDLVDEILGPDPGGRCSLYWKSHAMKVQHLCGLMRQLASQDPQDGSSRSQEIRAVVEDTLEKTYAVGGQYQIRLPSYCQ